MSINTFCNPKHTTLENSFALNSSGTACPAFLHNWWIERLTSATTMFVQRLIYWTYASSLRCKLYTCSARLTSSDDVIWIESFYAMMATCCKLFPILRIASSVLKAYTQMVKQFYDYFLCRMCSPTRRAIWEKFSTLCYHDNVQAPNAHALAAFIQSNYTDWGIGSRVIIFTKIKRHYGYRFGMIQWCHHTMVGASGRRHSMHSFVLYSYTRPVTLNAYLHQKKLYYF